VEFEWDPAKSESTYRTRGFDFAYASRIFQARFIESEDTRTDYGETRMKAVGQVGPDILAVIYTRRGAALRIISARRANRKERAQWQSRG
jgi:uncharacterized DUF497 family protein